MNRAPRTFLPPDGETLLSIARLRDALGVVSVYVDATPEEPTGGIDASVLETRNALGDLEERVRAEGPRERWAALNARLEALEPELSDLLDRAAPGRGRALFASVGKGPTHRVSLQLPLPNRVVLDETAYVRPLVSALEAGRPAGLAAVSRSRVRVLDWRLGQVEEIGTLELELDTENWRMMQGPAAAGTPLSQESATQEDRFFRRLARKRAELLAGLGSEVAALVERHGWERVLVAGDPRLAKPLVEALSAVGGVQTLRSDVDPGEWLPPAAIAAALLPRLEKARARQDLALVEETRAAALRGGRGAIGLQDALAALLEGRVDRLFLDDARDYAGLRGPDGELFPEGVQPAGLAPSDLEPEPRLAERMIERALETRARVTPVAGPAADALADCDGVAAALRW